MATLLHPAAAAAAGDLLHSYAFDAPCSCSFCCCCYYGSGSSASRIRNQSFVSCMLSRSLRSFRIQHQSQNTAKISLPRSSSNFETIPCGEEDVSQGIAALLRDALQLKMELADPSANWGIGPDMRDRADKLYERVKLLKQSTDNALRSYGRVPAQLLATFKGLQREHSSLENIVRLATKAGPVLVEPADIKHTEMTNDASVELAKEEDESVKVALFQGMNCENDIEVIDVPKYMMSSSIGEGMPQASAIKQEIERRVMEQLVKKQATQSVSSIRPMIQRLNISEVSPSNTDVSEVSSTVELGIQDEISGNSMRASSKSLRPQIEGASLEAQPLSEDVAFRIDKLEAKVRMLELEDTKWVSLQLHEHVVNKLKADLHEAREQTAQVIQEVAENKAQLVAIKGEFINEQNNFHKKVEELMIEVSTRITAEEMNAAVRDSSKEVEAVLKNTQENLSSLELSLKNTRGLTLELQKDWNMTKSELQKDWNKKGELQAAILGIQQELSNLQNLKDSTTDTVLAELGNIKNKMQEAEKQKQANNHEAGDRVDLLELLFQSHKEELNDLRNESSAITRKADETRDALTETLLNIEGELKQVHDHGESLDYELDKQVKILGFLKEELKIFKSEQQSEMSNIKDSLQCANQSTRDLQLELKNAVTTVATMQDTEMQEPDRLSKLEKKVDLMETDAQAQRHVLVDEVRVLVTEILKGSQAKSAAEVIVANPNEPLEAAEEMEEINNLKSGFSQEGDGLSDERAASLESFFSVMGQLIRQEVQRISVTSAQASLSLRNKEDSTHFTCSDPEGSSGILTGYQMKAKSSIMLIYETCWEKAFIQYCCDEAGWTTAPGVLMKDTMDSNGKPCKILEVAAARMEFVVTDSNGAWDRDPNGHNYVITEPGCFKLSGGSLQAVTGL